MHEHYFPGSRLSAKMEVLLSQVPFLCSLFADHLSRSPIGFLLRQDCRDFDFYLGPFAGKASCPNACRNRIRIFKILVSHPRYGIKIPEVGYVQDGLDHVVHRRAREGQAFFDMFEHLSCLPRRVIDQNDFVLICRGLRSRNKNKIAISNVNFLYLGIRRAGILRGG